MKILVLMGGRSSEREVALVSGEAVAAALAEKGHEVWKVDTEFPEKVVPAGEALHKGGVGDPPVGKVGGAMTPGALGSLLQTLEKVQPDLVYPALHGGWGENGALQGLLEIAGLPYMGSGILASAAAMNKQFAKEQAERLEIPTPNWVWVPRREPFFFESAVFPEVVKPNSGGSTFGFRKVENQEELSAAVKELKALVRDDLLVEEYVPGKELTCAVLEGEALPLVEIRPRDGFYDYEHKYTPGATEYLVPAPLPDASATRIQEYSTRICRALRVEQLARVDFRVDPEGGIWFLEVNTLPGMTPTSLVPMAAAQQGRDFGDLLDYLVRRALRK